MPALVASDIFAACWFTASTAFANPAVTLARALTQTFAGIRPDDVPGFVGAQALGALAATAVSRLLVAPAGDVNGCPAGNMDVDPAPSRPS